jgi:hypothetical protein
MAARFKSTYKNGPILPAMSLKCHQARAKVRASHVRLTYAWSTLELTKSLLIVGKTLFLGNGAGYGVGSNLRCAKTISPSSNSYLAKFPKAPWRYA